jgi:proteasome lid subunit RPN8/RPN11
VSWRIRPSALAEVVAHARQVAPAECCGVLVGRPGQIVAAAPTGNLSDDPNRFLIDPKDHLAALHASRRAGLDVVGFYHSHPRSAAVPSERDLAELSYPDCLYLIVGRPHDAAPEVRLFRMERGGSTEVALSVARDADQS